MLKYSMLAIVVLCGLLLGAVFSSDRYILEASPTQIDSGGNVTGSFRLRRTYALQFEPGFPFVGRKGVKSNRIGGACLLVEPNAQRFPERVGIRCTSNSQCNPAGSTHYGYCAPEGRCWVKPTSGPPGSPEVAKSCNRSVDVDPSSPAPWQADVWHPANRAPLPADSLPGGRAARWRVTACLFVDGGIPCNSTAIDPSYEVFGWPSLRGTQRPDGASDPPVVRPTEDTRPPIGPEPTGT